MTNKVLSRIMQLTYKERVSVCKSLSLRASKQRPAHVQEIRYWDQLAQTCKHLASGYNYGSSDPYVPDKLISLPPKTEDAICTGFPKPIDLIDATGVSPNGLPHSIYTILWKASINYVDIGPLASLSSLGYEARLPINEFFTDTIYQKTSCNSFPISSNCLRESITIKPENHIEEANIKRLCNRNDIPWTKMLNGHEYLYPHQEESPARCSLYHPNATLVISASRAGATIAYPFFIGHTLVMPIYSNMLRGLSGVLISNVHSSVVCSTSPIKPKPAAQLLKQVGVFIDIINSNTNLLLSQDTNSIRNNCHQVKLLLGHTINYGHTLINESSFTYLACKHSDYLKQLSIYPIIGHYDYLKASSLLTQHYSQECISYLSKYELNGYSYAAYLLPGLTIIPGSSRLPTSGSLRHNRGSRVVMKTECSNSNNIHNQACNEERKISIYISHGGRKGARSFANVIPVMASIGRLPFVDTIILDGLTSFPRYSKRGSNDETIVASTSPTSPCLQPKAIEIAKKKLDQACVKLVIIDGMDFQQKIEACAQSQILCAITPYGSSAMFPIYALNTETILVGYEQFSAVLDGWRWHLTRLCHPDRQHVERYCPSSEISPRGFDVKVGRLVKEVRAIAADSGLLYEPNLNLD